jgi:hypothetical protein
MILKRPFVLLRGGGVFAVGLEYGSIDEEAEGHRVNGIVGSVRRN